MHRRSQRIDVTSRFGNAAVSFRWRVPFGADHRSTLHRLKRSRDADVDQDDVAIAADHDVRPFQVTEDDRLWLMLVEVRQHIEDD
jgi:hypothetical protein